MRPEALTTYGPSRLFIAARNEVLFGPGTYRIAFPPRYARALMSAWSLKLLEHPHGCLLKVLFDGWPHRALLISRSSEFDLLVHNAGYEPDTLDVTCATPGAQLRFFEALRPILEKVL
jgi:hypothetical protein